jgi:Fe-S cluster biosynthesis and repair protein YggX
MANEDRIAKLRSLAESDPGDELAHFSLGTALLDAGQFAEAGPCFQRVLALNSQNSKAYQCLGEAQKGTGHTDLAVQTLTNGYRVAHRRGDLQPMKAMAELLQSLGAAVPALAESKPSSSAAPGKAGFVCRRCGGAGPPMAARPFKGPLGEKILATVCQSCWKEWVGMGTKVINELRLPMFDPAAQEQYDKYMKEFLMLE